jgi:gluconolactonase
MRWSISSLPLTTLILMAGCALPRLGAVATIQRLAPELDELIAPEATVELLAEGFSGLEGSVWHWQSNALLVSDRSADCIFRLIDGRGAFPYLKPAGGPSGLALDSFSRLVICQRGLRRIARLERTGQVTALAERFDGRMLNGPLEAAIDPAGEILFTDSAPGPNSQLPFAGVFCLARDGQVTLLNRRLSHPTGIALVPEERSLYVVDADTKQPRVVAISRDTGTERAVYEAFESGFTPGGLKVDGKGNLYIAGSGGVLILSPEGERLGLIVTGYPIVNCAWGDEGRSLYVVGTNTIHRVCTLEGGKLEGVRRPTSQPASRPTTRSIAEPPAEADEPTPAP